MKVAVFRLQSDRQFWLQLGLVTDYLFLFIFVHFPQSLFYSPLLLYSLIVLGGGKK